MLQSPAADRAVARTSATTHAPYRRSTVPSRHANVTRVPDALAASLRSTLLTAWRMAPRITERQSMPFRTLARTHDWRWPSIPRLLEAMVDMNDTRAWDKLIVWAEAARRALQPSAPLTLAEAWDVETRAECDSDLAVRRVCAAPSPAAVDAALAAVEHQLAAGYAVREALLAMRTDDGFVRPMGVPTR